MFCKRLFYSFLFFVLLLIGFASCEKEYSYEGGATAPTGIIIIPIDTIQSSDTVRLDPGELPPCTSCDTAGDLPAVSWSFKTGNSLLCGRVDTAIMLSLERNTFTFFGPATCGIDTGLIFTVSLGSNFLNKTVENVEATNAVFYYYHTLAPYILVSHFDQSFKLTITSYNHITKVVKGTFSGTGYRQDSRAVIVSDGKFNFKLI